jgi:predicted ATPase
MTSWRTPLGPAGPLGDGGPLFVGRLHELAELERIWASVLDESRQVVFVGGEPGVGKSRLVAEAANSLHEHGAVVLWGACHADLDVPYRPFVAAIEGLLAEADPASLATALGDDARHLLRLTPAVRRLRPDLATTVPNELETRFELYDAVRDLLLAVAEDRPVVVVLEDLHWASTPTLQMLRHLVQSTARTRLLLLVTHRSTAPDRSDELTYAIADLYRHDGVTRLDLGGLETDDIADYLVRAAGLPLASARSSAAVLRDQTAGNAFFLHELWRELSSRGGVDALHATGFRAPRSVRDTLERRLADLPAEHTDVLALAAVVGEAFELSILLEAADHPQDAVLETLDLGARFGLFTSDAVGHYRFQHALVRQAVLDRLPTARQLEMHARIAGCLERRSTGDPEVVVRLAHHYERAHAIGYAPQAVSHLAEAAHHARRSLAHEEAADRFLRAAAIAREGPRRAELLLDAARSLMAAGDFG